jgi:hypothetical protein
VKYRLFNNMLHGHDLDAERVYRWHIQQRSGARFSMGLATDEWKHCLDDYVNSAQQTFASMLSSGFMKFFAVPIDPDQELLDGSHRVACALALEIETIPVVVSTKRVWAPPWGKDWFIAKQMPKLDLERTLQDWEFLNG